MQFDHPFPALLNAVIVALAVSRDTHALPSGSHDTDVGARQSHSTTQHDTPDFSNITTRAPHRINVPITEGISQGGQPLAYTMRMTLGTMSQASPMLFDTGSGTFWATSDTCPQRGSNPGLGPSTSETFEDLEIPWSAAYGSGSTTASGKVARDSVKIRGLTMRGFPIGAAHTLTGELADSHGAGIAGFTNGKIDKPTRTGGITILEGLRESGLIPRSVIGIQMVRGQNGAAGTGQVTLGGMDSSKFKTGTGNLVRMGNQDHSGLWAVRLRDVKVDGRSVRSNLNTILDTGSSRIMVSPDDADSFHNYPGAFKTPDGIYGLPCDHTRIPTMSFQVGSAVFTLNPVDIIGMRIGNRGLCYSLIQSLPTGRTQWILGIPFMKSAYQILDSDANEITLAKYAE